MRPNRIPQSVDFILLILIMLVAAYIRFTNIATNPGWYTDEGTDIEIARHLQIGEIQYLAVNQSFLLFGRPPLFQSVLALTFNLFGEGIGTLRSLTASLGLISIVLLYWIVRRADQRALALLAAAMLAIYPNSVIYSRIGYSYNLLTPLVLLAMWGLWEYLNAPKWGWLALSGLALGIGSLSNLMSFNFILPLVIVVIFRRPRDLLWVIPLIAAPFALYALGMMLTVPQAFLFDVQFTLFRLSKNDLAYQLSALWLNFYSIISRDLWIGIGVIGLFSITQPRLRNLSILMLLSPLFTLGRTVLIAQLGYYYIVPLLPFFALGVASIVRLGVPRVFSVAHDGMTRLLGILQTPQHSLLDWLKARAIAVGTILIVFYVVIGPLFSVLLLDIFSVSEGFVTPIQAFLLNADEAQQAIDFVNQHALPNDLVIASPGLAWGLNTHVADFQMMIAYNGVATEHLPDNIPADRWVFDPRYSQARYVIIDNLWTNWAVNVMESVQAVAEDVQTRWRPVFQAGAISVYENPVYQAP